MQLPTVYATAGLEQVQLAPLTTAAMERLEAPSAPGALHVERWLTVLSHCCSSLWMVPSHCDVECLWVAPAALETNLVSYRSSSQVLPGSIVVRQVWEP